MANKVFWQNICRLRGKRSQAAFFQWCHSERSRCYFESVKKILSDLSNPVDTTPIHIHEEQIREDVQITEADVNIVIKSLKIGKAPGEDDIRPEMLKAMNSCLSGSM